MPFGRYRNMDISELPEHYLLWLLNWPPLRDPLKSAVGTEAIRREVLKARPPVKIDLALVDEIVRAGVRTIAKSVHPDVDGDNQKMAMVNRTADQIRELVAQCS